VSGRPPATDLGYSLGEPVATIRAWTEKHINAVERARSRQT